MTRPIDIIMGRDINKDLTCLTCESTAIMPNDFRDDLSRKEFLISHMCQVCQDGVFGLPF